MKWNLHLINIYGRSWIYLIRNTVRCMFISLISLWIYHQSCPNYIERETGVIWHLKTVAADAFSGKAVYIMQSTKTAEVLAMNMQDFNNRFRQ